MYGLSYFEVNGGCILILLIILKQHLRSLDKGRSARILTYLLISIIIYTLFDLVCGLEQNQIIRSDNTLVALYNICFYYASYSVAFWAFLYAEYELQSEWITRKRNIRYLVAPLIVLIVITPLTLWTKFFFYIDENGMYQKGAFYFPMLVACYGYIIAIGIKGLIMLPQKKYYALRSKIMTTCSFVIFPLVAGAIQAFHTGVSIICFGATIAMIQVYISIQDSRITVDNLTQISNRTKLIQYLDGRMKHAANHPDRSLYLLMMDVDQFKRINDEYGHAEGDVALIRLANNLKRACAGYICLLARYGGDEFSVVLETDGSEEEVHSLLHRIQEEMDSENQTGAYPYLLEISIGWAKWNPKITTIPEFIQCADKELYSVKKERKKRDVGK